MALLKMKAIALMGYGGNSKVKMLDLPIPQVGSADVLVESGSFLPVIDKVFPLEKTADALEYLKSGRAKGKVVIKIK